MTARLALLILLATSLQAVAQSARDLTIRLFDTDRVTTLTITPLSSSTRWKPCPTCTPKPLTAPLTLTQTKPIQITGPIRIETDTHRQATAAGLWQIATEHNALQVRVTIPSERYVAAVLLSEAAPDEPPASLRALAIAARSYALDRAAHHQELCDSTRCQAMRLAPIPPPIAQAVLATTGETLWFANTRVPAYFTQSSGGATEEASAAWSGPPQPWLTAHPDPWSDRTPSQWHADIPTQEIRTALAAEGYPLPSPIRTIAILTHTPSGRAHRIELRGTGPDHLQLPAATLRFAINRSLGWNRLRSDLYQVHVSGGEAIFDGKGYGHGVGLSQSGARAMAAAGRDEAAILRFYFPGTTTGIESPSQTWLTHESANWTLIATDPNEALIHAGNAALQRAQTLFPPTQPIHPTVRLFPTTNLYRNTTSEPGWTLAATRNDDIFLQPPPLITHTQSDLLLHEFLHVLIEHETTAPIPLWLHEGLVEALANPTPTHPQMTAPEIEDLLAHPRSLAESQHAHREAGLLVERLIAANSLPAIRTWLHSAVPAQALTQAGLR